MDDGMGLTVAILLGGAVVVGTVLGKYLNTRHCRRQNNTAWKDARSFYGIVRAGTSIPAFGLLNQRVFPFAQEGGRVVMAPYGR